MGVVTLTTEFGAADWFVKGLGSGTGDKVLVLRPAA